MPTRVSNNVTPMVPSKLHRFALADIMSMRAQVFAMLKVVVKDYHRQTLTDAQR